MARALVSSPSPFLAEPLSPLTRHGRLGLPLHTTQRADTRVRMSFHGLPPPPHALHSSVDLFGIVSRVEGLLYTLADAAAPAADASTAVQKNGRWFGFISDTMEVVLKVLKDGLTAVHVPYAYGFAIILLTVIVKVLTFPLTKQQDGYPPLGWSDAAAYLVLPVLLVVSQYVSLEIMKTPQQWQTDDPAAKNSLLVFYFLPLMIGYFSLSIPSGLSIYWFTINILGTTQQIWLRKLGGAKPVIGGDCSGIISAGRARRSTSQPLRAGLVRSKQLKEEENRKKLNKALSTEEEQALSSTFNSDDESDGESIDKGENLEARTSSGSKKFPEYTAPKKVKMSKRKQVVQ